jgi:hypothetical protein
MKMNQFYKKQPPKKKEALSFVALVKEYGDHWQAGLPRAVKHTHESLEPGYDEFHRMKYTETGVYPRIESCAELYE